MPINRSLYQSYTGGQEDRRSQMAEQAMQQSALNKVAQAEQERKTRTGKDYRRSGRTRMADKERALAAMANPAQFGQLYPAFAKVSKRVPMVEEMATRAFNQEKNKHFMRQKADEMSQKGDLQSARRYTNYASEMELKQKEMQKFAMDHSASELDEDAALISNIRDPSTYMFAKHLSALRGRELNLPDAYTEETGEMLRGRMIDIENTRESLGLQRMVLDDEEQYISGKRDVGKGKVAKGVRQSDMAQIQENIIERTKKEEAEGIKLQLAINKDRREEMKADPEYQLKTAKQKKEIDSQIEVQGNIDTMLPNLNRLEEVVKKQGPRATGPITGRFPTLAIETQEFEQMAADLQVMKTTLLKGSTSDRDFSRAIASTVGPLYDKEVNLKAIQRMREDIARVAERYKVPIPKGLMGVMEGVKGEQDYVDWETL